MSENACVSILMPVYNAAAYLKPCIHSIQRQTYGQWELIAVDDFSTDDSFTLLAEFAKNDSRITCYKNTTKGIIPALQLAFERCKGSCITRMDADDLMPSNKLETFVNALNNQPDTVVTGKVRYFSDSEVSKGYLRYENWLNQLVDTTEHWKAVYRECVIASPNWMVHRSCFSSVFSFSDLVYPEDYDMTFKWYTHEFKIKAVTEITHLWREHPSRTSRNSEAYQQKAFFALKTKRFMELELMEDETVQLIGAGQKGKLVAEHLLAARQPFTWFDRDAANRSTSVYNQKIHPVDQIKPIFKTILTVWPINPNLQAEIEAYLTEKRLVFGVNCWLF